MFFWWADASTFHIFRALSQQVAMMVKLSLCAWLAIIDEAIQQHIADCFFPMLFSLSIIFISKDQVSQLDLMLGEVSLCMIM